MTATGQGRLGHYTLLLAVSLVLFFSNLDGPTLWDLDEGRNSTASLEMLESGNFIVPTFNGRVRVDKPVLLYWLQAACFQVFGISAFAARLPSALAALTTVLCCYELGRAMFPPSTAIFGALIAGSAAMEVGAGRFANPDALLNAFIVLTLTAFWRGYRSPSSGWFVTVGVFLGLAALTKGPVGVALPTSVMVLFLAWEGRLRVLWDRRAWHGLLALALVTLPWYIWVGVETRGYFLWGFLGQHNLNRFLHPIDSHTGSPVYYLAALSVGMAPWSLISLFSHWYSFWSMVRVPRPGAAASWQAAAECAHGGAPESVAAYRLLGVWFACYVLFFSLAATKLPLYVLPTAVPVGIFAARFLDRWRLGEIQPPRWVLPSGLVCLLVGAILVDVGVLFVAGKISFGNIVVATVPGLEPLLLIAIVPSAATVMGFWSIRRGRPNLVVASLFVSALSIMIPLAIWALPAWNIIKAPSPLVQETKSWRRDEDIRIGGYQLEHLPSLNFYARHEVLHHQTEREALSFLHYQLPVYLFMPARLWETLKLHAPPTCQLVARHSDLYRSNDIVVVSNRAGKAREAEKE